MRICIFRISGFVEPTRYTPSSFAHQSHDHNWNSEQCHNKKKECSDHAHRPCLWYPRSVCKHSFYGVGLTIMANIIKWSAATKWFIKCGHTAYTCSTRHIGFYLKVSTEWETKRESWIYLLIFYIALQHPFQWSQCSERMIGGLQE